MPPRSTQNRYARLRAWFRDRLFRFVDKIVSHPDGRRSLHETLEPRSLPSLRMSPVPYSELQGDEAAARPRKTVFITARFRSGSTLLWNLFRHIPEVTAYYEPLNERRWFDPQTRGERVDATHRNATNYWQEYDGLIELAPLYRQQWIDRHLFMNERSWDWQLKRYIETLVDRAKGIPVLQFNRVDFRLPWLKATFPHAQIVHLYRHPRDQWCSTLMQLDCFGPHEPMSAFAPHDKFYLLPWAADLKYTFPFLDEATAEHPYEVFYYLWRLSYLFGKHYADASIGYEELMTSPQAVFGSLLEQLDLPTGSVASAAQLVEPTRVGKWTDYAPDVWFRKIEERCERTLEGFWGEGGKVDSGRGRQETGDRR